MCKRLFLSTLAISGQRLTSALSINNGNHVGIAPKEIKARNKNPSRGFKWDLGDQDFLEELFRVVPKAEGHYCRKDSKNIYLSQVVPTMSKLYIIYKAIFQFGNLLNILKIRITRSSRGKRTYATFV